MTFREWQELTPENAAREIHARVHSRLSPPQQRAAIALLRPERELAEDFAASKATTPAAPLAGVPYFVKDLFDVAGLPMFAGSTFLPEVRRLPEKNGAAVAALNAAGAVVAGKTHLHEFAYGITGQNPHYGDCEHPRFPGRTTGGSSSGSAAAVAAGIVPLALGTDTGGSIRVPAAFCGLYGFRLRPVDSWICDAFPLAPTFDTAGWFTANIGDMRTMLDVFAAPRTSEREPRGCYLELADLNADVAAACRAAAARLAPVAPDSTSEDLVHGFSGALEAYHTTVAFEAWQAHQAWADRYRDRYDPVVWQRLIRGRSLSTWEIDAAAATRAAIRVLWTNFFAEYDFLVLPAAPAPALTPSEFSLENRNRILTLTAPASIGGLPVLTIPVPLPNGLSTGLQIIVNDPQSPVVSWALDRWSTM